MSNSSSARRLAPLEGLGADALVIHEIYASVQGESTHAGRPCTFVRTTACNLRCLWCDTAHAFMQGERRSLGAVVDAVVALGLPLVEITGGEPLLQPAVLPLMATLCDRGYEVLLETSGSIDIRAVDPRVKRIVDFKAPDSGEVDSNLYDIAEDLRPTDEVKLVLASRRDYDWAKERIATLGLAARCTVLMGPVFGALDPKDLVSWIVADRLPVRMQLQLHKHIWEPKARGV